MNGATRTVWAKSWPHGAAALEGWLPLWRHLQDAAGIAARLWDQWLPPLVHNQVAAFAGGDDGGRALLSFLAGVHDVGKATPAFAVQVGTLRDEMVMAGLPMPQQLPERATRPHGLAGQAILETWLEERHGWRRPQARALASVVGGHHGIPPSSSECQEARGQREFNGLTTNGELLGTGAWVDVQCELLERLAARTGAETYLASDAWRNLPSPVLALALAGVVVADWLASNSALFPLSPVDHPLPQPTEDDVRVDAAWAAIDLPRPWTASDVLASADALLAERFELPPGTPARPVQVAAVAAAREMDPSGILVVEAPMGEGKTEAAMLAAEILAARSGAAGVLIALPTQATADAMFKRVMRWIAHQSPTTAGGPLVPDGADQGDRRSVFLAHGKAWLNPDYAVVPHRPSPVLDVGRDEARPGRQSRTADGGAYVDGWMSGRRKGVLADFVVGTIDQVLFGALQARHVALRHLALARKVVVLDEIHSFDAYMNTYLERSLEWLGAYGVPVVALSATLPTTLRDRLVKAYQHGRTAVRPLVGTVPRRGWSSTTPERATAPPAPTRNPASSIVTFLGADEVAFRPVEQGRPTRAHGVAVEVADDDDVPNLIAEALADGGCALVVRNTVRRAQEMYRVLRDRFGPGEVLLLHSRFLASDRKAREQRLVGLLGRPPTDGTPDPRPSRLVVVATQVVEQSLDVDFDLLVTDLAPTDLLLQRIGRLHRHERPERPRRVRDARAVIVGVDDWSAQPPTPVRGSVMVYGSYLLFRAAAQMLALVGNGSGIRLPDDIAPLVEVAYGDDDLGPDQWQASMREARRRDDAHRADKVDRAAKFRLPAPKSGGLGLTGWLDRSVGEADVGDARAQVRDSQDSFEVLVVQADSGGQWRLPDWLRAPGDEPEARSPLAGRELPMNEEPSLALRRALAGASVRLPDNLTRGNKGDDVINHLEGMVRDSWQRTSDLAGQLVLALDGDKRADLPGGIVTYDPETGLDVEELS